MKAMSVGLASDLTSPAKRKQLLVAKFTHNIHSEVVYRFLFDDYRDTNFPYRAIMHGAQITLGLNF